MDKHSLALALTTTALYIPVSETILSAHSISLLTMVTPNTFFITLHKFLYNIFLSKIKPAPVKEKLVYVSLQFFQMAKKSIRDRNINFHHIALYYNYFLCRKLIGRLQLPFKPTIQSIVSCTL